MSEWIRKTTMMTEVWLDWLLIKIAGTIAGLVGAAFFVFFLAVIYEALKTLREYLLYATLRKRKQRNSKSHCPCSGGEMAKIDKAGTCELGMCETPCECPEKRTPEPVVGFASLPTSKW